MKFRQIQTVALTFLLVLLPTLGKSQRAGDGGTPIIVGDGSVHIRCEKAPFDSPGSVGNNWDMTKNKEFHRSGAGKTGQYEKVSLIGRTLNDKDWTTSTPIVDQLVNFATDAKDICKVEVKIGDPPEETITIYDEGVKTGMIITSSLGLAGPYKPTPDNKELARITTNRMTEIDIYTESGKKPTVIKDKAFIEKNCPSKLYLGCGIQIEYNK
jgi:hypothetical protein